MDTVLKIEYPQLQHDASFGLQSSLQSLDPFASPSLKIQELDLPQPKPVNGISIKSATNEGFSNLQMTSQVVAQQAHVQNGAPSHQYQIPKFY